MINNQNLVKCGNSCCPRLWGELGSFCLNCPIHKLYLVVWRKVVVATYIYMNSKYVKKFNWRWSKRPQKIKSNQNTTSKGHIIEKTIRRSNGVKYQVSWRWLMWVSTVTKKMGLQRNSRKVYHAHLHGITMKWFRKVLANRYQWYWQNYLANLEAKKILHRI